MTDDSAYNRISHVFGQVKAPILRTRKIESGQVGLYQDARRQVVMRRWKYACFCTAGDN
jgi:hypothetical protein